MRLYVYEGTPDEILKVQQSLGTFTTTATPPTAAASDSGASIDEQKFVNVDVALRMLTRISLSVEQKQVLVAIYNAHPKPVSAATLQKLINYSTSEFAGMMGAFGRRLTHTEGYVSGRCFFDQHWDASIDCNQYKLPESAREAMRQAKLV